MKPLTTITKYLFYFLVFIVFVTTIGLTLSFWYEGSIAVALSSILLFPISIWSFLYYVVVGLLIITTVLGVLKSVAQKKIIIAGIGFAGLVCLVAMPYFHNASVTVQSRSESASVIRITKYLEPTSEPARRLEQRADVLLESGCRFWLERWSADGRFIRLSERPYGSKNCLAQDEAVFDIETQTLQYTFSGNFLEHPGQEQAPQLAEGLVSLPDGIKIIDALPNPDGSAIALVVGKNDFFGPQEIYLLKIQ